ncbi:hypothetical protein Tco_0814487 [Tanacetum coccineum]
MSSLETLIMQHNERAGILITPIRLTFIEEEESNKGKDNNKGPQPRRIGDVSLVQDVLANSRRTSQRMVRPHAQWLNRQLDRPLRKICREVCLEKRFADQVPQMVTEMMKRVDGFIKSEEAYKSIELPKGEHLKNGTRISYKGKRPPRSGYGSEHQRMDNYGRRDHYQPYVPLRAHDQRQLEATLESGKLSHLVKDVRQRGNNRGKQPGNNNRRRKVINMIWEGDDSRKRKSWRNQGED